MSRCLGFVLAATLLAAPATATAVEGLITKDSVHAHAKTLEKLEAALKENGFTVFAKIDHSAAARGINIGMPASTVVLFGNPRGGTPAMISRPTLAIDLPMKALVWEDEAGKVYVSYNASAYVFGTIYGRHAAPAPIEQAGNLANALTTVTDAAVK